MKKQLLRTIPATIIMTTALAWLPVDAEPLTNEPTIAHSGPGQPSSTQRSARTSRKNESQAKPTASDQTTRPTASQPEKPRSTSKPRASFGP